MIDYNASDVLSSENQAVNAFEIGTWQILAPQVWQIYGADNFNSFTASGPLAGYPYVQQGSFTNRSDYQNCAIVSAAGRGRIITYYPNYLVYVKLASSSDQGFSFSDPPPPVAVAAMDQLGGTWVDFHDVLAGRNWLANTTRPDRLVLQFTLEHFGGCSSLGRLRHSGVARCSECRRGAGRRTPSTFPMHRQQ